MSRTSFGVASLPRAWGQRACENRARARPEAHQGARSTRRGPAVRTRSGPLTVERDGALLRLYVIRRSSGAYPCPEYARRVPIEGVSPAWVECDEPAARGSDRWNRMRIQGRPWCRILGTRLNIVQDIALQSFFATATDDDWLRLEQEVRRHPRRCLSAWCAAGHRVIEAIRAAAAGHRAPGRLSGWPIKRGTGSRSLASER